MADQINVKRHGQEKSASFFLRESRFLLSAARPETGIQFQARERNQGERKPACGVKEKIAVQKKERFMFREDAASKPFCA